MKEKTWNIIVLVGTTGILFLIAIVTIVIDPFFHYHKPLEQLEYPMQYERYQNDGISRWFQYDAIITGTSMTQNFKVSEFNELMDVTAIKTAYAGATLNELSDSISRSLEYNPNVKVVLCSLDGNNLNKESIQNEYDDYPTYLYDSNIFNDVNYLFNKDVMTKTFAVINYTRAGNTTPTMDEYGSWWQYKQYGEEVVSQYLTILPIVEDEMYLTEEDRERIRTNVSENVLTLVLEHPKTEFYFFIPPYSRCFWEALSQTKQLNMQIEAEMIAIEILLNADNVHIYGFSNQKDIVQDLNNYTDTLHYSADINSRMLQMIACGEGELTEDNYKEYYEIIKETYE